MKQFLASILALTTLFAPAACGGQNGSSGSEAEKDVESADTSSSEEGGAFVYWLNFKPELDETARKLAKKYTAITGVPVRVVTAASGT